MADEKRIVIEIVDNGDKGSGDSGTLSSTISSSSSSRSLAGHDMMEYSGGSNMAAFAKYAGAVLGLASMAASVVGAQALKQFNMYVSLAEDYKTQQDMQNMKSIMSGVASVLGSTAGGAVMGSALGPAGTVVGAVIGFGSGVAQQVFSGKNKQFEQNLDISTKGYSIEYNRNLSGLLVGESRNTEN